MSRLEQKLHTPRPLTAILGEMMADRDQAVSELAARLQEPRANVRARNRGAIALLDAWLHTDAAGDPAEQAETWAFLEQALGAGELARRTERR